MSKDNGFLRNLIIITAILGVIVLFILTSPDYKEWHDKTEEWGKCYDLCEASDLEFYKYENGICECEAPPETIEIYGGTT